MQLLEQNVKHNTEDIREVKKRLARVENDVHDLRTNQQVSNQSLSHVMDTLSDLKIGFKELDSKMDASNMEQLKEYKNAVWKVGATIIATVIGGFLLFSFGL
ncbi:hypothetical protein KHA93_11570 [Bacillus sp. FJAT-49732]|uniref:Uncharacterized protein n=1 Tax=Lederbergia citrisecunda TaxID=2833583 RepID=A0A942YLE2_9BACI|nr:hypothetical protein [Lederbergia citrisecunda]MBS4200269.1 hypothetical protein [Lederbergia citrisecunda]